MKHLPKEIRQRFKSDMRVVVDYLAEGAEYIPTEQEITDLDKTMHMLYVLTGETDFIDDIERLQKRREKGEKITMEYALTRMKREGREQGIKEGIREKLCEQVRKKLAKGRTVSEIAEELEEEKSVIEQIIDGIAMH